MDKITATQFEALKEGLVTTSFEMLDVNGDDVIDDKDLALTQDSQVKSDIQKLLSLKDEDPSVDGDFDLTDVNKNKQAVKTAAANSDAKAGGVVISGITMPEGYETVDVSDTALTGKTNTELQALLAKINNNIKLITARMTALDTEYASLGSQISTLQSTNATLASQLAGPAASKSAEEAKLPEAQATVTREEETLKNYTDEYENLCEELERINNRIRSEQHLEEMQYERSMAQIADDAIKNYDPSKDGEDFEAYYLAKMNSAGYVAFSGLTRLNSQAEIYATAAGKKLEQIIGQSKVVYDAKANVATIQANIKKYEDQMGPIQSQIDANNREIQAKQALQTTNRTEYNVLNTQLGVENTKKTTITNKLNGGGLSAKELLALIPQAEKDLAKNNNIDLKTCFVAKGKADGVWHIYLKNGKSLARQYGKSGGYDIIAKGNGYVNSMKENESGTPVYTFTEINDDMTDGTVECKYYDYKTSSPLSFDVNGDGLHTSTDTVLFDIDGDGELDTINNSAEWVLAFDKDHNGKAGENGTELFGDNTDLDGDGKADGYEDGFAALKALAKKEGLIGENDSVLDEKDIALLSEKYGLTMTNGYGGEAKSLSELGITQINLAQTDETYLAQDFDGNQNDIMRQDGATFVVNGETREYADFWHSKKEIATNTPEETATAKVATTNQADVTLQINDKGVVALKGKVDFNEIKNKFKYDQSIISEGEDISKKYVAQQEEKAEEDKKTAQKEEADKAEAKKAEQKQAEEKEADKKKNIKE